MPGEENPNSVTENQASFATERLAISKAITWRSNTVGQRIKMIGYQCWRRNRRADR